MSTKTLMYPNGKIMFKDFFDENKKLYKHFFYALKPKYHLYLSVHYTGDGKIKKYIKHKYPSGYYEYLELLDNGYLKDKLYLSSPYCKYIEKEYNNDYYLTVHRYNIVDNIFVKRSSEFIKNGLIIQEKFYKNGRLVENKIYENGKPIKLYKNKKDQPKITERK